MTEVAVGVVVKDVVVVVELAVVVGDDVVTVSTS